MRSLEGKRVVITGAGSGIGRALALEAARQGARLALADLDGAAAEATVALAKADALTRALDVRDGAALADFAAAVAAAGGADVLVNNAGVSVTELAESTPDEDFRWVMDVNFWGVVRGTRAFLSQLRAKPESHLVNVSSMFGLVGAPDQAAYSASKFAVRGYTEALAQELRSSPVRVTCAYPGAVRTNILRSGRGSHRGRRAVALARFDQVAMTRPDTAAARIWKAVRKNQSRVVIGPDAWLFDLLARWFPARGPAMVAWLLRRAAANK